MHTHNFWMAAYHSRYETMPVGKSRTVKTPAYDYYAYLGAIPKPSELINPRIMRYELA
jgi:hypothetical protein